MEPPLTSKVLRAPNLKRGQENIRIQDRVSDESHVFFSFPAVIFFFLFPRAIDDRKIYSVAEESEIVVVDVAAVDFLKIYDSFGRLLASFPSPLPSPPLSLYLSLSPSLLLFSRVTSRKYISHVGRLPHRRIVPALHLCTLHSAFGRLEVSAFRDVSFPSAWLWSLKNKRTR